MEVELKIYFLVLPEQANQGVSLMALSLARGSRENNVVGLIFCLVWAGGYCRSADVLVPAVVYSWRLCNMVSQFLEVGVEQG